MQQAIATTKSRQQGAVDGLVRAAGQHAARAVDAAQQAAQQFTAHEEKSDAAWRQQMGNLEASQRTQELTESLEKARKEIQIQQERSKALENMLTLARQENASRSGQVGKDLSASFHNTCLLVKLLLNTRQMPENVLTQELFDEVQSKGVPVDEWPTYVHSRMSGGQPISSWF